MPKLLLPLVALLAVGGSAAGASVYLLTRDETVVEVLPSPVVEASPTPDLTPAPAPSPTPTPAATQVAGKAPDGCLSTELAYVDPAGRFAFCYPKDMEFSAPDTGFEGLKEADVGSVAQPSQELIRFGVINIPYRTCDLDLMTIARNITVDDLTVDSQTVKACHKDHYDRKQADAFLFHTIDFAVTTEDGRPVVVYVNYSGAEEEEVVKRVLYSTVIY